MRILVSGGGTAGHISPILATVDALKSLDKSVEILYVGQKGSLESKIAASSGLEFASISAGKFRRYPNAKLLHKLTDLSTVALNARDLGRLGVGFSQSLKILRRFKPDAVFIKGGYVGLPVGLAAGVLRIPYVVHESDIVPGLTNRILSKRAAKVATGFPVDKYSELPAKKLIYTGSPIRQELLKSHRLEGLAAFELEDDRPVVLVIGGSLGAKKINDAIIKALPILVQSYQVLHLAGERDVERVRFEVKRLGLGESKYYHLFSFLMTEIGPALAAADVVVSRAGANTIAELAVLGKPSILIPAPQLRDQPTNAQVLARAGAVRVIQESRLSPDVLLAEINHVIQDEHEQQLLVQHIKEFAVPDAATKLARLILEAAKAEEVK